MNEKSTVGRKPNPARHQELREALVEYVLAHGVADLSLRPLAEALGTSTYVLVYHFGSKEGVLAAALSGAEERLRAVVASWTDGAPLLSPADVLRRLWQLFSAEQMQPYVRLFFEAYGLALRDPQQVPGFLEHAALPWIGRVRDLVHRSGVSEEDAETVATLIIATVNGLQLDLVTSGDRERTTQALEVMATVIEGYVEAQMHGRRDARARTPVHLSTPTRIG